MYFNSKLLFDKSFYVSNLHSSTPNILSEWQTLYTDETKIKMYKRKYNKNYSKYNLVLKKLYKHSINTYEKYFQVFQQIAIRNKINLKELVSIEINRKYVSKNIINYITKNYPNVIIKTI